MFKRQPISRREFLRLSAFTAATATLVACGGGGGEPATEPPSPAPAGEAPAPAGGSPAPAASPAAEGGAPATPSNFAQAPMLQAMVDAGELPPVEERLPTNPYVVPHPWLTIGNYGGILRLTATTPGNMASSVHEMMYGHSPLRWLKDGQEIGPGLIESWESNDDASEWTLHFREGLKWSDGEPWTTADIMYWWEDLVLNEDHPESPPDEARSGTGTLMEMTAPDDVTIVMSFDAPAPLTADRLAMWVKAGIGPRWMAPHHYLEQFHPKYNDQHSDYEEHDEKMDFRITPDCPVMSGWRLREYEEGVRAVWERNPFYWCVDSEGNQLPYIDRLNVTSFQDPEVQKVSIMEGQADYVHGGFTALFLDDVAALRQAQPRSKLQLWFWDAGDGSGSLVFFNQDYRDDKMRELIRNPTFRQALSHAYDREEVQKVVYYNLGELTTGTLSPKAIEYNINEEGQQMYTAWRDSYIEFNPDKAKAMLDEIGVVDADGDGFREMPDGSKLVVRLDFHADTGQEHLSKNELLAANWKDIGINTELNPVPPAGYAEAWRAGEMMTNTNWETGDGPNHLVYPQWLVPIESSRWAPLQGEYYNVRGTPAEGSEEDTEPWDRSPPRMAPEEGGPIDRLWQLYDQSKIEPDAMKRHRLVWDMIKIHIEDGPYLMGVCANTPYIVLVHEEMRNVPRQEELALGGFAAPWIHPTPAVYDPEAYYWENPEAHS